MSVQTEIEEKIAGGISCQHLEVINESGKHNVPAGSESHFRVVVVSGDFEGERLLARHRKINGVLSELLAGPIHALAMHTYTGEEWRDKNGDAPMSPPCKGGSA